MLPALALRAAASALNLLFPARCSACDAAGDAPFCAPCAETLLPAPAGCPTCGAPADEALLPALRPRRCVPCRRAAPPFTAAAAPYLLGGALAEAIHRLKYEQHEELAAPLGVLFEACSVPKSDLLVPIPLHPRRLRQRGYDQAALLATAAGRRFHLPQAPLLRRIRDTGPQVGRDRAARERNLRGAFAASRPVAGLSLCLVDDVLTTGATAAAAASALLAAGARRVEVRTLARAP